MPAEGRKYATVSRIAQRIAALLEPATNAAPFWVQGELSSLSSPRPHLYCDLIESSKGRTVAKVRCNIWKRDLERIRIKLRRTDKSLQLKEGIEVGLLCKVDFDPVYGLSLTARDIDPEITLGALAARRREILARLEREGLLPLNARNEVPLLPTVIGLVASRQTAGYADFVQTLEDSRYGIRVLFADARVQGNETETSILAALDCLAKLRPDLVVIIRGGGSKVDLSHLDNEEIARRIAALEIAVWTGIGHETDESVLDRVAARSFKTPTAVGEAIVERFSAIDERLGEARRFLKVAAERRSRPERERLIAARARVRQVVEHKLESEALRSAQRRVVFHKLAQSRVEALRAGHATLRRGLRAPLERIMVERARLVEHRKSVRKTADRFVAQLHRERRRYVDQLCSPARFVQLSSERERCRRLMTALLGTTTNLVQRNRSELDTARSRFRFDRFISRLEQERGRHGAWSVVIRASDPQLTLKRGYALVETSDGELLRTVQAISHGSRVTTRLHDGVFESVVEKTEPTGSSKEQEENHG